MALITFDPSTGSADTAASLPSDIPAKFTLRTETFAYIKREQMIPIRDGIKLKTFILIPKGATRAPLLLTRTPYNASAGVTRFDSPQLAAVVPQMDDTGVAAGYIIVFQDGCGKMRFRRRLSHDPAVTGTAEPHRR